MECSEQGIQPDKEKLHFMAKAIDYLLNRATMNSNTSGTTMTSLDVREDSSIGDFSTLNGDNSNATPSLSSQSINQSYDNTNFPEFHKIYNYVNRKAEKHKHSPHATSEEICIDLCKKHGILPTTRLIFGLRVHESSTSNSQHKENEWAMPGDTLRPQMYAFRIRFKIPALDTKLQVLDPKAYEYLYRQMRDDMLRERIPEICYPRKKDNVVGLGVVDMYIDELEKIECDEREIISNYKRYLPGRLIKAHKLCVKTEICKSYRALRLRNIDLAWLKWNYVHDIHELAGSYLMERYTAIVTYIPGDEPLSNENNSSTDDNVSNSTSIHVYVEIDLNDTTEPGLKIARMAAEDNLKWTLVANLNKIHSLCASPGSYAALLEITGYPKAFQIQFESEIELKSFITYLGGYIRLTSKWMLDLCGQYTTPSLKELKTLKVHGPIGGHFSSAKLREKRDECGRYLIRQCEKEYDVYYIDMNTRIVSLQVKVCKMETFKIKRDIKANKWDLYLNNTIETFEKLNDLVKAIPADSDTRYRIQPSEYDKPSLLLICLPKKQLSQEIELELNESQLQRKRVQIFDPKIDLQWHKNSTSQCNNGKMLMLDADWLQKPGSFKDVSVTLKVLKSENDLKDFMKVVNTWSKMYSPQFIKLYGITLSSPRTMVLEHAPFGPLNQFLAYLGKHATTRMLLEVVHNLVRGMVYMHELNMVHGNIRCSNIYVTKFDPKTNFVITKISDPGLMRPYTQSDLPWIPFEYYSNLNAARGDRYADMWAFATTMWEIFARGKTLHGYTSEALREQYRINGAILPEPSEDCPEEMYTTMMDGWADEPQNRFDQTEIFRRLTDIKQSDYAKVNHSETISSASLLKKIAENKNDEFDELFDGFNDDELSTASATIGTTAFNSRRSYMHNTPSVLQAPFGKIVYKKIIGQGHYGQVWEGEIQRKINKTIERERVAIKKLKKSNDKSFTKDFEREIKIMQDLNHPNIVKIKQWILKPIIIIMEYIECGSFLVYLTTKPDLTDNKLLHYALDIAKGMEYLGSKSIIHRDLAARNILVDGDHVKISDFGLAQICDSNGYYRAQSAREIPYKWYSPDALRFEKYSFYSDVWSYGVTLFEMFSRGEMPNLDPDKEITQTEFLERLERGDRLRKPQQCMQIVYEKLMLRCWHANPKLRPTFKELVEEIKSILDVCNGETN